MHLHLHLIRNCAMTSAKSLLVCDNFHKAARMYGVRFLTPIARYFAPTGVINTVRRQ